MAAEPVRLFDPGESPNARRYGDRDREAAYELWRTTGGRSLRRVAEATGIALSTLGTWSQRDGWVERARREDDEDRRSVRSSIGALVMGEALKSVDVARKLRDDESGKTTPKVRLDACIWLAGLAGISPIQKVQDLTAAPADEPATLTPQAAAALSQEERSRRKREYEEAYAAKARGEARESATA